MHYSESTLQRLYPTKKFYYILFSVVLQCYYNFICTVPFLISCKPDIFVSEHVFHWLYRNFRNVFLMICFQLQHTEMPSFTSKWILPIESVFELPIDLCIKGNQIYTLSSWVWLRLLRNANTEKHMVLHFVL